jgi:hypothetical protein
MRWGAGFFRIWVLISISWLVVVCLIAYEGVAHPWIVERGFVYEDRDTSNVPIVIDDVANARSTKAHSFLITSPNGTKYRVSGENAEDALRVLKDQVRDESVQSIQTPLKTVQPLEKAEVSHQSPKMFERFSEGYRALEEMVNRGNLEIIEFTDLPQAVLFVPSDLPKDERIAQAKNVHGLATKLIATLSQKKREVAIREAAGLAILPSALLLLLGFAVSWVFGGFYGKNIVKKL